MNYLAFTFTTLNSEQSEQLIALLNEQNFDGFEENELELKAFIKENLFDELIFKSIVQLFPELTFTKSVIENINWNQQWENSFEPVVVDDFVAVRASFHQPILSVQHQIIITPKMSFGTGHHATTFMMMKEMQAIDFKGKEVFDFGTGTAILAILAEKLGAQKIFAIDNDEWSITNSKENIDQNNCKAIILEEHSTIPITALYDIILANINLNVITDNIKALKEVSKPVCTLLLSGFLKENENTLKTTVIEAGFQYSHTVQKGQWIAMVIFNKLQ